MSTEWWIDSLNVVIGEIKNIVLKDVEKFTFSEEQLKAYETVGGTPFLDNGYTVFGEVVSGIEIIDSICTSPTLPGDSLKNQSSYYLSKLIHNMFDQIHTILDEVNEFESSDLKEIEVFRISYLGKKGK